MYRVERSSDLVTWGLLNTVTATGTLSSFVDSTTAGALRLCYRIVAVP